MIKLESAKKNYKNFSLDVSMEVKEGMVCGLVGTNGAGKTTTFKMLLGLIKADGGEIKVFGKKISELTKEEKQEIGVVLLDSGFCPFFTAKDVIKVMQCTYPDFDKEKFILQCEKHNLPLDKKLEDFSTGMKTKFKILVALSHETKVLILDEPTTGLDVVARDECLDLLREYMEKPGHSILISSHISGDLEGFCDEVYLIHEGSILLQEEVDVLMDSYGVLKVKKEGYESLDKSRIVAVKKENFGYSCLTREKDFYSNLYPDYVIEKGSIDNVLMIVSKGKIL